MVRKVRDAMHYDVVGNCLPRPGENIAIDTPNSTSSPLHFPLPWYPPTALVAILTSIKGLVNAVPQGDGSLARWGKL